MIRKGLPAHRDLLDAFGPKICDSHGEIDRGALARIVFDDPGKLEQLNRLVHPRIRAVWSAWTRERRSRNEDAAVQVPLLFETGADAEPWDAILCVTAPEDQVLARLRDRGLDDDAARRRVRSQMPLAEKARRSDHVIRNDGTIEELTQRTLEVLRQIQANTS